MCLVIAWVAIHVGPRSLPTFDDVLEVHALTVVCRIHLVRPGMFEPRVLGELTREVFARSHLHILQNGLYTVVVPVDWEVHPDTVSTFSAGDSTTPSIFSIFFQNCFTFLLGVWFSHSVPSVTKKSMPCPPLRNAFSPHVNGHERSEMAQR